MSGSVMSDAETTRSSAQDGAERGEIADLSDPARVAALQQTGLHAAADPEMEFLADWVRRALDVPLSLVSLVSPDRQLFPGVAGLVEPLASQRSTPLSHSFSQHVVATAEPLVITDASAHPLVQGNPAARDLGVIAYAGMPLTDESGNVLGSLWALDTRPRQWTEDQLDTLRRIATMCSTVLRLRLARFDAGQESVRRDEFEQKQANALERHEVLLHASRALTATRTVDQVLARARDLIVAELDPAHVQIVLVDQHRDVHHESAAIDPGLANESAEKRFTTAAAVSAEIAIRDQRIVYHVDPDSIARAYPPQIQHLLRELRLQSVIAIPLPGADGAAGAIVVGWSRPGAVTPADLPSVATIAGFAGQALDRAQILQHRTSVAHELQNAMLTTLPDVDGLVMAARYEPADTREHVGGDWFDAAPIFDPDRPGEQILSVSVGDILGHTVHAATIMGQVRAMLRQSAWDHPGGPPSAILTAFEDANLGLKLGASGTTILAHLRHAPGAPWSMHWTNAGHPPPVLLLPDGTTELLTDHDALFGYSFASLRSRVDHQRDLPPGTTVFLYTDGLVERRGHDIDDGIDALLALLDELRGCAPQEIVDTTVERLASDAPDDVVTFAIHVPGYVGPPGCSR